MWDLQWVRMANIEKIDHKFPQLNKSFVFDVLFLFSAGVFLNLSTWNILLWKVSYKSWRFTWNKDRYLYFVVILDFSHHILQWNLHNFENRYISLPLFMLHNGFVWILFSRTFSKTYISNLISRKPSGFMRNFSYSNISGKDG